MSEHIEKQISCNEAQLIGGPLTDGGATQNSNKATLTAEATRNSCRTQICNGLPHRPPTRVETQQKLPRNPRGTRIGNKAAWQQSKTGSGTHAERGGSSNPEWKHNKIDRGTHAELTLETNREARPEAVSRRGPPAPGGAPGGSERLQKGQEAQKGPKRLSRPGVPNSAGGPERLQKAQLARRPGRRSSANQAPHFVFIIHLLYT